MQKKVALVLAYLMLAPLAIAQDADRQQIEALIEAFNRTEEETDMEAQAKLMTEDRIWVSGAGRRSDQAQNMKIQQAGMHRNQQRFPTTQAFHEVRDPIIRLYGDDAAVASFYWYRNWIRGAEEEGPNVSQRLIQSLFLVKRDGQWKIAYSHSSPFHPDQQ
ncbi:MAG TPA: SgcJ/EcaC family oxidoreductase [Vicinamibacterales bacterium]|nr:SgcJ/EcaC family oxidoreductase [Vicinamibacterales bacterium]